MGTGRCRGTSSGSERPVISDAERFLGGDDSGDSAGEVRNDLDGTEVTEGMVAVMDKAQTDSGERFDRYVLPELDVMYRTAWSLTRADADAQDLVQETLLRAYRAIDRFDGRHPRAWLLTIMRNANINRVRKKKPDLLTDPDATFERSTDFAERDHPESLVVDPVFDVALEQAYTELPDMFREIVELVDLNGLAYQEAADVLDIPVGTVMSRLHRARKRIRDRLAELELDGLDGEVSEQ